MNLGLSMMWDERDSPVIRLEGKTTLQTKIREGVEFLSKHTDLC